MRSRRALIQNATACAAVSLSRTAAASTTVDAQNFAKLSRIDTVAALRGVAPSTTFDAVVSGYYAAGDGGGGRFRAATGGAPGAYVENGGTVILPTGGDGSAAWLRVVEGAVSVRWFGAKGDNVADDVAPLQAAVNSMATAGGALFIPAGTYRVTSPISIPASRSGGLIFGEGDATRIVGVNGVSCFKYPAQGYYRFTLARVNLIGTGAADVPAIDCTPAVVTYVCTAHFENLRICSFKVGWKLVNAQLCVFQDCNYDGDAISGTVFQCLPNSGTGQQCNSNRVYRLRVTGANVNVIDVSLPTATERATNWLFESCDFQQSGTTTPLTVRDMYYRVLNCEFENFTGGSLIQLISDNNNLPNFCELRGNILIGGGSAGAGKIKITRLGSQWPQFIVVANNDAGSSSTLLAEIAARDCVFIANQGAVTDTFPAHNLHLAGTSAQESLLVGARLSGGRSAPTYGKTVSIKAQLGNLFDIVVVDGNAFTISSPTNAVTAQRISIRVKNATAGAMGLITWGAAYRMAAWTNPVAGTSRTIDFYYDGINWIEVSRTLGDVPN